MTNERNITPAFRRFLEGSIIRTKHEWNGNNPDGTIKFKDEFHLTTCRSGVIDVGMGFSCNCAEALAEVREMLEQYNADAN